MHTTLTTATRTVTRNASNTDHDVTRKVRSHQMLHRDMTQPSMFNYCGMQHHSNWTHWISWVSELWFLRPTRHKQVILETFPKPVSWLAMEKLNLTQQKHAFTNQNKCTTTQNKQKNKARYNRLLWHLAWKWRGPILVSMLHKSVTNLLT